MQVQNHRPILVARVFVKYVGRFLLIERVRSEPHNGGTWEVPGGKIERGDDERTTARKETWEETGFRTKLTSPFLLVDSHIILDGPYAGRRYMAFFCTGEVIGGSLRLNPREHSRSAWVELEEMNEYNLAPQTRTALTVLAPYLVLPNKIEPATFAVV